MVLVEATTGEVRGTIGLAHKDAETAEIRRFYVASEISRQGLGRRLLGKALGIAQDWGCQHIVLTTDKKLPGAQAFYERNGFTVKETKKPKIIYQRELSPP